MFEVVVTELGQLLPGTSLTTLVKVADVVSEYGRVAYGRGLSQGRADGYADNLPSCPSCGHSVGGVTGHVTDCEFTRRG